jgi:preprotein translocase subunit Sec61beta
MSKRKKQQSVGMPQSSAGLMRFFQDETNGVKIPPEFVVGAAILLIVTVVAARIFFPIAAV